MPYAMFLDPAGVFLVATRDEPQEPWLEKQFRLLDPTGAATVFERWLRRGDVTQISRLWRRATGSAPPDRRRAPDPRTIRHAVSKVGGFVVLRQAVVHPYEPRALPQLPPPARSLAEEAQSLLLVMVDAFGNPVTEGFSYQCTLDEDGMRSGSLTADGMVRQDGLKPGGGTIEFPALHADAWFERAAPPEGWIRKGLSLSVLDAHGVPLGKQRFQVTFENGTVARGELDEAGCARLEQTPSYPLRLEFQEFDAERWS